MADNKILQAILGGQVSIREDIKRVEKKVEENGQRIDNLGMQIASLEDKAPGLLDSKALMPFLCAAYRIRTDDLSVENASS